MPAQPEQTTIAWPCTQMGPLPSRTSVEPALAYLLIIRRQWRHDLGRIRRSILAGPHQVQHHASPGPRQTIYLADVDSVTTDLTEGFNMLGRLRTGPNAATPSSQRRGHGQPRGATRRRALRRAILRHHPETDEKGDVKVCRGKDGDHATTAPSSPTTSPRITSSGTSSTSPDTSTPRGRRTHGARARPAAERIPPVAGVQPGGERHLPVHRRRLDTVVPPRHVLRRGGICMERQLRRGRPTAPSSGPPAHCCRPLRQ